MNITEFEGMSKWNIFNRKKNNENEKEIRYVLSIDGGGMRGIIPAYILHKMETALKEKFSDPRPLYSHFDLIAGTSTGALIALAMTLPTEKTFFEDKNISEPLYDKIVSGTFFKHEKDVFRGEIEHLTNAEEILSIYLQKGAEIFKSSHSFKTLFGPIFNDRYDGKEFDSFLFKMLGDTKLSECRVPTIAISYDTNSSMPYIFSSENSYGFLAREAARASSAAPTYFPSANLIDRENNEALSLIDGGIIANNPILLAYREARKLYPNADEIKIISLSTCAPKHSVEVQTNTAGAVGWANPIFKSYGEAQLALADMVASSIKDISYTRVWAPTLDKKIRLDDYSEASKKILLEAAGKTYLACEREIDEYLLAISKERTHSCVKLKNTPALLENKTLD